MTISGNAKIENATGGYGAAGIGGGAFSSPDKIGNGNVVIKENAEIDNVQGGAYGAGIGGGVYGLGNVTIEGNTNNGSVARRTRAWNTIAAILRPAYSGHRRRCWR